MQSGSASSSSRRQIETDYDSVTAEHYLYAGAETAWDDFVGDYDGSASDTATAFEDLIANYAVDNNGQVLCAGLTDPYGVVAIGLWAFDDGDIYDVLGATTAEDYLDLCETVE